MPVLPYSTFARVPCHRATAAQGSTLTLVLRGRTLTLSTLCDDCCPVGWEGSAGGSDLAQPRARFVWLFIGLVQLRHKTLSDLGCAAVCVRAKRLPKLNSAPQINRSFPKFWMLNQELLWMRLKPLTRLDAGSALRWELARTDTFSEPTVLPGREWGHRVTNHACSGDMRPQTLCVDCKESTAKRSLENSLEARWHSASCFERAGRAMLLVAGR